MDHRSAAPEFVALDIGGEAELPPEARPELTTTLPSSFPGKSLERDRVGDPIPSCTDATAAYEKQVAAAVHVDGSPREQRHHPSTPTAGGACKRRRAGRRVPGWRDPRKILFAFAALSSVGTLILLYFTLSMGKMAPGQADGE